MKDVLNLILAVIPLTCILSCQKDSSSTGSNDVKEEFHTGMIVGRVVNETFNPQIWSVVVTGKKDAHVLVGKYQGPIINPIIKKELYANSDGFYQSSDIPIGLTDVWGEGDMKKNLIVNENIVTNVPDLFATGPPLVLYGIINESVHSKIYGYNELQLDASGTPIIGGISPNYESYSDDFCFQADSVTHRYKASYAASYNFSNFVLLRRAGFTEQYYVCIFHSSHKVYNLTLDFSSGSRVTRVDLP